MFYSQCLLSRKGSLGVIWVAAYFFKRLKKAQVFTTDISSSVDDILQKELDVMTYRVLAYLLLGLVRIYSKKVEYLCDDCQDMMIKINDFVASHKSKTHLIVQRAPLNSITLPDRFELDAFDLEIVEDVDGDNVLPHEEITLKDGVSKSGRIGVYSLGKYPCEEFSAFHDTCFTEYGLTEDSLLLQSMEIDMDVSTSHDLSMQKRCGKSSSQAEWVNFDTFCGNDGEHTNSINLSGEDRNIDGEHIKVPVIAEPENGVQGDASTEKHQNKRSPGGGEEPVDLVKLHSEENQSDGGQMKVAHLAESEKEMCQAINEGSYLSNLQARTEKLLDHRFPQEVCMDVEMVCGSGEECPELSKPSCEEHHTNLVQLNPVEMSLSRDGKCHSMNEENPVSTTVDATPQSKFPDALEATTPEFTVIHTPATKDRARNLRKRKCCVDDVIVFPNNVIKQCLEDASDLVSKRRKAPCTSLTAWKAFRISNLSQGFLVPLLPCISSELSSLFCLEKSNILETAETVESPERKSSTVGKSLEQIAIAPETPTGRSLENMAIAPETPKGRSVEKMAIAPEEPNGRSSEQEAVAPETPVLHSREKRPFEIPESKKTSHSDMITQAHSFQDLEKVPSSSKDQEHDLILLTEEPDSCEADNSELHGLSARTRMVARYLHRRFLNQKKRRENEVVNLMQLLEGKTKKGSARLFYEILVLKSKGYVDVKQDDAYGDILVQKVPKWDHSCAVLCP
ncbi:hypothetical protein ACOSP7_001958 [Xanthoceras sorbifolium]